MLISPAYAQSAAGSAGGGSMGVVGLIAQFALIGLVFWFFILRPQNQRIKAHKAKIDAVKKGDQVVTAGGLVGKITRVIDDGFVEVEIAANTKVRVVKSTLTDVIDPASAAPAND
jgi:preprotein translocase subunit YajC